jgi:hypothetical protein
MAKTSGLGDNFYVGGYDLSGDISSVDKISGPTNTLDVTPVNASAHVRVGGQRAGVMQFTTFFDFASAVTSPSFPLTTVPYVSTYAFPVIATITGGTVTNVAVNGSNVGSGDGSYLIPGFGSITVTYTGSPSWAWKLAGQEHNALSPLPTSDIVVSYLRGTTLLNVAACCIGKQLNYDFTRDNKGDLTAQVEVDANAYGVEWGLQLTAGLRTDTAATTGSAVNDNGGSSAFGAQAYLQLVDFVGTSVDVTIQHCTTSGGTYATLIDFGSLTGIGSSRQSVSNSTTVDQYLKVVTTGTFTYATFAVVWVRNQFAVVF